jgi:hypothetical protein
MRIWKWTLDLSDVQPVIIPKGAKLLSVQMQGDTPQLWVLCDEKADKERRHIAIYGTGTPLPDEPGEFISTFQLHGGALVFHAFEVFG